MRWTVMRLAFVLALAAVFTGALPAAAASLTFALADPQATQTPAQIFVRDANARAESDDRGIVHIAGFRGLLNDDESTVEAYNADGEPLLFTVDKWRAAGGTADASADPGGSGDRITLALRRLIAFGHYSVFLRTTLADGVRFAALDGSGVGNNFDAKQDGSANVVVSSPSHVAAGAAIVVIYHSDAHDHGNSPGDFGRTAHQHVIARVP
ncbi:MAG: hypothetical protein ABR591_13295 [Candidatus Velthaea sp.]